MVWALLSYPTFSGEAEFASSAQNILSGEAFGAEQLSLLKRHLDGTKMSLRSVALVDVAVLRLRLLETGLASANLRRAPEFDRVETAVTSALGGTPSSSFLWLAECWIEDRRIGAASDKRLNFLRMSYATGPNEAWIAVRRNPVALSLFSSLPNGLAQEVLSEFAGLVQSGLYADAAKIVAGPGWVVHEKLLNRLAEIKEADRYELAKALESENLNGALIPGVSERPFRPF